MSLSISPSTDLHRPVYHFAAPPGTWINDPVPYYDHRMGRYHVFLQHNPGAAVWGDMHWLHVSSTNLTDWENHGIALAPSRIQGDSDFCGVWTGCITRRPSDGRYIALYTAIPTNEPFTQVQCAAFSDDLMTWEKYENNPLPGLSEKPDGYGDCFRDPQTFLGPDGKWYCVIGGEQRNGAGGVVFLYEATDDTLLHWQYRHLLFEGGPETGYDFECPDFFPIPGSTKWMLITSRGKSWWHVGTLDKETMCFTREAWGECDNELFYAAKSCVGASGERLLWGWIREGRSEAEQVAAGWSGVLSLPRRIRETVGCSRYFEPTVRLPERLALIDKVEIAEGESQILSIAFPNAYELLISFRKGSSAKKRGISLRWKSGETLSFDAPRGHDSFIRLYVDQSLIQANYPDGTFETHRLYTAQPSESEISIFAVGADVSAVVDVFTVSKREIESPL